MAASTSTVCDDDEKKIRKMSLTYLKNTFQKKSLNTVSIETGSSNVIGNNFLPKVENQNHNVTNDSCGGEKVTESSARSSNNYSEKSLNRDTDYNEIGKLKSNGFFRSIKKRLNIRDLKLCKSKQKIKAVEPSSPSYGMTGAADVSPSQLPIIFFNDKKNCDTSISCNGTNVYSNSNDARNGSQSNSIIDGEDREPREEEEEEEPEYVSSDIANSAVEPQAGGSTEENGETSPDSLSIKKKFNLTEELLKLSKYGWYWGPISRDEADTKLANEPDGAFLVRDSSADKYLLTLSFKSSGKLLHTRVEHSGGLFSLYYHPECERFSSVVALINHSMSFSQSAVYCYSRPRYPGHPAFPVRLTKPVSRFTQVRSLQYLCRFVIRQNTRVDNIDKLPLPDTIRGYIEEAHY